MTRRIHRPGHRHLIGARLAPGTRRAERRVPCRRPRSGDASPAESADTGRGLPAAELRRLSQAAAAGDRAARDRIVAANLNLVRHVARRYRAMGHDAEELFQVGCVGLIKAADRFDPGRGTRFSTYAVPLILGEIQRYLRDTAPAGLGRGAHRLARAARAQEEAMTKELERTPTAAEVAAALGVSVADMSAAIEAAHRPMSLDEQPVDAAGERRGLYERLAAGGGQEWDQAVLRALVERLPARERQVVILRYFRDRSQSEVGMLLGLSQPQISRLEKRALQRLRRQWTETPTG